jgi:hypothetical protein
VCISTLRFSRFALTADNYGTPAAMPRWGPCDVRDPSNVLSDLIGETRGYDCAQKPEKKQSEEHSPVLE